VGIRTIYDEEDVAVTLHPSVIGASEAAAPMYKRSQAEAAEAWGDILGVDTPKVTLYKEEQDKELSKFQTEYPDGLFGSEDKLGWWQEQTTLNSLNQIVPFFGYMVGTLLQALPFPVAKGLGKLINAGTFAVQYEANFADTLQEHEERAGRPLTDKEKGWAAVISGAVVALDKFVPGRVAKDVAKGMKMGKSGIDMSRKSIIARMNAARQSLHKSIGTGAKYVGVKALQEGGLEGTQKALQILSSKDPNYLFTKEGMESLAEEAVIAGPLSGVMSTPGGLREATAVNRDIAGARSDAGNFNKRIASDAGDKFIQTGVSDKIDRIDITPAGDILSRGGRAINTKVDKLTGFNIKDAATKLAYVTAFKPATVLKDIRDRQTTGKKYAIANDMLQGFIEPGNTSNERKVRDSFYQVKDTESGQLLGEVTATLDQLSKHPLFGLGGRSLSKNASDYIYAKLTTPDDTAKIQGLVNKMQKEGYDSKRIEQLTAASGLFREKLDMAYRKMKDAGIPIGYIENYLYNPISEIAVTADRDGFITDLVAASVTANKKNSNIIVLTVEQATVIADGIIQGKDPSVLTSKYLKDLKRERKGQKKQDFEKSRSDIWQELPDKYREKDLGKVLEQYLLRSATRIASAKTFGPNNADRLSDNLKTLAEDNGITQEESDTVWDLYDAVHNTYKKDVSQGEAMWRKASKLGTSIGAVTHLGLATLSSLPELIWVGERAGFGNMMKTLPEAFNYAFKGGRYTLKGKTGDRSEGAKRLARLGFNLSPEVNDRLDQLFATDRSAFMSAYFRSPFGAFLTQWTNFTRNWAAATGLAMMNDHAKNWKTMDSAKKNTFVRELREQGITESDFEQIIEASRGRDGKINISIMDDNFLDKIITKEYKTLGKKGTQTRVIDIITPWLHKIVSDVVVQPNAVNKPLWMSNPSWSMMAQLKTFPIVFGNTIVKRLLRKLNPRNCSADFGLAISVMGALAGAYALAYIGEQTKAAIRGSDPADFTLIEGANKIGLTAVPGMLVGAGKYGAVESALGVGVSGVGKLFEDVIYPIFGEAELGKGTDNLTEWLGESILQSLGPAGIAIQGGLE
jgi:hypothetical protein